ncbi:MAG: hypothetical protein H0V88_00535 [Pyrinomonadaceae bacterium]|nr:hypothetical protein [Pyrinomonadaceae bacterium]
MPSVFNSSVHKIFKALLTLIVCFLAGNYAYAQTSEASAPQSSSPMQQQQSTVMLPQAAPALTVARASELACGGFIEYAPGGNYLEIVGGEEEQEQRVYAEGDVVFINAGRGQGSYLGQEFSVVRPRGQFTTRLTNKKGFLGVYTQEVGRVRVTEVKENVSVAIVSATCETILNGDLLRSLPGRVAPPARTETTFDRFADPTGKQMGRIVLARDGRELVSRDQIVFIDLGAEDNVRAGDYLTIFRPAGTGNITRFRDEEIALAASGGFESERFRGGKFSNQAQRVRRPNHTGVYGPTVSTPEVRSRRPPVPRKVVGEMVILNVQRRTATAVITRVAQEVHTGDYVEVQ